MANIVCPAWSETQDATVETQRICDKVKGPVEQLTGKTYEVFNAVKYRIQHQGGADYLIKVFVGVEDYIHLSVHEIRPLVRLVPRPIDMLQGVEQRRTKDDPLVSFVNTLCGSSTPGSE